MEARRSVLIFLEGEGLTGGWTILAQKLRSCSVNTYLKRVVAIKAPSSPTLKIQFVRTREASSLVKEACEIQGSELSSIWLQFGDVNAFNKINQLKRCLSGSWGELLDETQPLTHLKNWAMKNWRLQGTLLYSDWAVIWFYLNLRMQERQKGSRGLPHLRDEIQRLDVLTMARN